MHFPLMTQNAFTTSRTTLIGNRVYLNQDLVRFYNVDLKRARASFFFVDHMYVLIYWK